jgi:mannose-6-phosphate isomerase-like protein (cupin superfamily)
MAGYAVKRIDDMETAFGSAYKRARAELGVEAFGLQVLDVPANTTNYPEHDHANDGQEEVYVPLRGAGEIEIDGERFPLEPGTVARVGPGVTRKLWTGDEELRVLAIGGVPGAAYEPPEISKLGAPDPLARNSV